MHAILAIFLYPSTFVTVVVVVFIVTSTFVVVVDFICILVRGKTVKKSTTAAIPTAADLYSTRYLFDFCFDGMDLLHYTHHTTS